LAIIRHELFTTIIDPDPSPKSSADSCLILKTGWQLALNFDTNRL